MSIGIHVGRELAGEITKDASGVTKDASGVTRSESDGHGYAAAAQQLREKYGSRCIQMFIMSPHQATMVDLRDDPVGELWPETRVYAHCNYLSHMIKPTAKGLIHAQIKRAIELKLAGLVVHLENAPLEENVAAAASCLEYAGRAREVKVASGTWHLRIVFEINALTPAISPSGEIAPRAIFHKPEVCRAFVHELHKLGFGKRDFGLGIDTAHLWSCGLNVRFSRALREWFEAFGDPAWIALFHLNDSASELGGADVHEAIGAGRIWPVKSKKGDAAAFEKLLRHPRVSYDAEAGFIEVLRLAKRHKIDVILERGRGSTTDVLAELQSVMTLSHHLRS